MYTPEFFKDELAAITDKDLGAWVLAALQAAPSYFWTAPASLTQQYHSLDDNVEGGLCHHSAKVSWMAGKLFECAGINPDIGIAAGILHDIVKFGTGDSIGNYEDYKRHPEAAAEVLGKIDMPDSCQPGIHTLKTLVCNVIHTHQGKWGNFKPTTESQWLTHYADVAASIQHFVALKFYDPEAAPADVTIIRQRFIEDDQGYQVFQFGKYKDQRVHDILQKNPQYVDWLIANMDEPEVKEALQHEKKKWLENLVHPGALPGIYNVEGA